MRKSTKKPGLEPFRDPFQDEAIRSALLPFWRVENKVAQAWGGIARLQSLVPPDLSARYGSAYSKLQQAIQSFDAEETARKASVCIRGLEALDIEAKANGSGGIDPRAIYVSHHGKEYIVALDRDDLTAIKAPEGVPVLSLQELLEARSIVLASQIEALDAIQAAYQGAEITYKAHDDALPF